MFTSSLKKYIALACLLLCISLIAGLASWAESKSTEKSQYLKDPIGVAFGQFYKGERFINLIKTLGVKKICINLSWEDIEPIPGNYQWDRLDKFTEQLSSDVEAVVRLKSQAGWATGKGTVPRDLDKYYNFIYNTVKRTKGKVRYFENDWEADLKKHWSGTAREYVDSLKTFYKATKAANPEANVIVGGHSGAFQNGSPVGEAFFIFLFREGRDYFDLFDLHLYGRIYDIPERVGWFKNKMAEFGINKKIVATEYGGPTPLEFPKSEWSEIAEKGERNIHIYTEGLKGYPERYRIFAMNIPKELEEKRDRIQAREITQRTLLALSSDVQMVLWWNLRPNVGKVKGENVIHPVFGKLSLVDSDFKPKPAFNYYQVMSDQLSGVKRVVRLPAGKEDIYLFKIEKWDGSGKYVVWHKRDIIEGEKDSPVIFDFKTDQKMIKITDVFGKSKEIFSKDGNLRLEITDTPQYFG